MITTSIRFRSNMQESSRYTKPRKSTPRMFSDSSRHISQIVLHSLSVVISSIFRFVNKKFSSSLYVHQKAIGLIKIRPDRIAPTRPFNLSSLISQLLEHRLQLVWYRQSHPPSILCDGDAFVGCVEEDDCCPQHTACSEDLHI